MPNNKKHHVKKKVDLNLVQEIKDTIKKQIGEKNNVLNMKEQIIEGNGEKYLKNIVRFVPDKKLSDAEKIKWGQRIYATIRRLLENNHHLFTTSTKFVMDNYVTLKRGKNDFEGKSEIFSQTAKKVHVLSNNEDNGTVALRCAYIFHVLNAAQMIPSTTNPSSISPFQRESPKSLNVNQQTSQFISISDESSSSESDSDPDDSDYEYAHYSNNNNSSNTVQLAKRKNISATSTQRLKQVKLEGNNNFDDQISADYLSLPSMINNQFFIISESLKTVKNASGKLEPIQQYVKLLEEENNCLKETNKINEQTIKSLNDQITKHKASITEYQKLTKEQEAKPEEKDAEIKLRHTTNANLLKEEEATLQQLVNQNNDEESRIYSQSQNKSNFQSDFFKETSVKTEKLLPFSQFVEQYANILCDTNQPKGPRR